MRILLAAVAALLIIGVLPASCTRAVTLDGDGDPPPNVILFIVDDLGWQDISLPLGPELTYQNRQWRTPNVERLASRGVAFTNAYASAPVCTPTRTSILTGRSPGRTHITYWTLNRNQDTSAEHPTLRPPAWEMNGLSAVDVTLPKLLRRAGYRTIHVGKAHFGAHGTSGADPSHLGFDVNIAGHASGAPASYYGEHNFSQGGRSGDPSQQSVWDVPGLEAYHGQDVFLTDVLAIEAQKAIRDAAATGKPFYMNFAPYAVHAPIMPNKTLLDHYAGLDPIEAAYGTMIESVDNALGSIIATLDELDLIERTVIIFTSDNGGLSAHARGGTPNTHNAPLKSGKGSAYEGGIRVPMVVAGPGVSGRDRRCDTPVITHDLFPTILAFAGAEIPVAYVKTVDGRDIGPLLRDEQGFDAVRVLAWNQPHQWGASGPGIWPFTAVRDGDWKLIYDHAKRSFELYNLVTDLGEEHDLAASEPGELRRLAEEMGAWIRDAGAQLSLDKETGEPIASPEEAVQKLQTQSPP